MRIALIVAVIAATAANAAPVDFEIYKLKGVLQEKSHAAESAICDGIT